VVAVVAVEVGAAAGAVVAGEVAAAGTNMRKCCIQRHRRL